jgi:hypothetical protein
MLKLNPKTNTAPVDLSFNKYTTSPITNEEEVIKLILNKPKSSD